MRSALVVLLLVVASPVLAAEKVLQNDTFNGSGGVNRKNLAEYEGGGVVITPSAADYPATVTAIDILCVPAQGVSAGGMGATCWRSGTKVRARSCCRIGARTAASTRSRSPPEFS